MRKELEKLYDPKQVEDRTYQFWQDGGYFKAQVDPNKKPYTIYDAPAQHHRPAPHGPRPGRHLPGRAHPLPPDAGLQRPRLPGTDHASIATEAKIVAAMNRRASPKRILAGMVFLERAWAWKETYGNRIIEQQKKMGSSCDWDRQRFTLDEGCSKAVREVFVKLYEKGLIYRGERIINWCPDCLTSISDAEVEYEEKDGFFWHIKYPLADGTGYLEVATTRPETMLGDVALAVHPDDERYKDLVGKTAILPLMGREIPIVADTYVEMDFGTGVVKITPAHDPNDFEVGLRHNLPIINTMNPDASLNENAGKYCGLSREEARKQVVSDLEEGGWLLKTEPYKHNVGTCYRCGSVVEPRISKQWFVRMAPLAEPAIEAVRNGDTKFVPQRFDKIYYNWMENIKDWCISRQLWWGHRIPPGTATTAAN